VKRCIACRAPRVLARPLSQWKENTPSPLTDVLFACLLLRALQSLLNRGHFYRCSSVGPILWLPSAVSNALCLHILFNWIQPPDSRSATRRVPSGLCRVDLLRSKKLFQHCWIASIKFLNTPILYRGSTFQVHTLGPFWCFWQAAIVKTFSTIKAFYGVGFVTPRPAHNMEDLFVWIITFDLSGMGDATSSYATAGITLRIIWQCTAASK
jgi:hypothetical protein